MNLPVVLLPAARREMLEAQDWYDGRRRGLGAAFRVELGRQIERLAERPLHFAGVHADLRRAIIRRFPYGLFFRVLPDRIVIVACFHLSRDPVDWRRRA